MRRSLSLRTRVAGATALVSAVIVATVGLLAFQAIHDLNMRQIDRKLEAAAAVSHLGWERAGALAARPHRPHQDFALSIYTGGALVYGTTVELPLVEAKTPRTVTVDGTRFRVVSLTRPEIPGRTVMLGLPVALADRETADQRHWVLFIGGLAVLAAGGLGWLLAGRAVRPIVALTRSVATHSVGDAAAGHGAGTRSGVSEADELADAVDAMLRRVAQAQVDTAAALATARDFAAAAAHELRTPLTAMRTDLEVLRTLDLEPEQRAEILADVERTQRRVEAALTALERLATGELTSEHDYTDTDLADLCDRAAHDLMRAEPEVAVEVDTDADLVIRGLPAGLRIAIDNALTNSVRHGGARRIRLAAHRATAAHGAGDRVVITVDDDGAGVPADERGTVFARFTRGSTAAKGGSGLGLALVAQQAQLHGGAAAFTDSPLGGARLTLDLAPG